MTPDRAAVDETPATAADRLAREIRRLRQQQELSQRQLASVVGYTREYISRAERQGGPPSSFELVKAIDVALDAGGVLISLREQARLEQVGRRRSGRQIGAVQPIPPGPVLEGHNVDVVHVAIPRLRRVLDAFDLPDDGPIRSLNELRAEVVRANDHRLEARYVALAQDLPDLISELARANQHGNGDQNRETAKLLTLAFRAADGIAFKFGYLDLSARLIDLMRQAAMVTEDPLLLAAVAYVRTESFFASGDLSTAGRALVDAADQVNADSPASAAAYGSLHMRAAVVAGRLGAWKWPAVRHLSTPVNTRRSGAHSQSSCSTDREARGWWISRRGQEPD